MSNEADLVVHTRPRNADGSMAEVIRSHVVQRLPTFMSGAHSASLAIERPDSRTIEPACWVGGFIPYSNLKIETRSVLGSANSDCTDRFSRFDRFTRLFE